MPNYCCGPWTTAFVTRPGVELSQLWRQRLRRLPNAGLNANRMSRAAWCILAASFAMLGGLPNVTLLPAEEAAVKSLDSRLDGAWTLVHGQDGSNQVREKLRMVFHAGKVIITPGQAGGEVGFQTDTSKIPHHFDLVIRDPAQATPRILHRGIYEFQGGALVLCLNEADDGARPTEFRSDPRTEETDLVLLVMARGPLTNSADTSVTPPPAESRVSTNKNTTPVSNPSRKSVLRGRIVDQEGQPLSGVQVILHGGVATRWKVGETATNEQGEYRFEPVPSGAHVWADEGSDKRTHWNYLGVQLVHPTHVAADGKSWRDIRFPTVRPEMIQDYSFVPGGKVKGRLIDAESGKPLADTSLRIFNRSNNYFVYATTDADGRFASPALFPGKYTIDINRVTEPRYPKIARFQVTAGEIVDLALTNRPLVEDSASKDKPSQPD